MENEEKGDFVDSSKEVEKQSSNLAGKDETENAADKYEEFAERTESTHIPFFPVEDEGMKLKNEFSIVRKKKIVPSLLLDKKKILLITGVLFAIVVITAGVLYFQSKKSNNNTNIPVQVEDLVINAAMKAMRGVQSYSYDGKMSFSRSLKTAGDAYSMDYKIAYKGVADKGTQNDPSAYSSIAYDTVRTAGENKRETGVGLESVIIGGRKYLRIGNFSVVGSDGASNAAVLQEGLRSFNGSWYSVSEESYNNFYTEIKDYTFLPTNLNIFDVASVNDFNEVFNHKILTSPEEKGAENVGEIETTRYRVGLNAQGVVELLSAFADKENGDNAGLLKELQNNPEESDKFKEMVDYVMKNVSVEIWIGKNDSLIHRFKISGAFDRDATTGFYSKLSDVYGASYTSLEEGVEDKGIEFDIDYTLSGFGTAKVREPEGAKDFTEVMDKLKSINPDLAITIGTASSLDTDVDGLNDEEERFYTTNPTNPDTDGDGHKDGDEVKAGYDPLVAGSARLDFNKLSKVLQP